ncbi:hypothetical protein CVD28_00110 [Bacillus sp. M6-12]|uniref:DUF4176 domain-containing protein n=1 Tax=Bacillus sp. M6-12 TaxID=2054166 RepID=UPI000C7671ED|nr:DUF4176 domain-containing protein [Bacillus sp. M6-12]PLS18840.1 hypothetical protein CVD28_00110 [Bacillus sp. M6-12]
MLEDVLLPIGSLVKVTPHHDEQRLYMIIGKRIINHDSLRAWDYISVPFEEGAKRKIFKNMEHEENFFYFNHHEIEEIVSTFTLPEATTGSIHEEE